MKNGEKLARTIEAARNAGERTGRGDVGGEKIGENDLFSYRVSDALLLELGKDAGEKVCKKDILLFF